MALSPEFNRFCQDWRQKANAYRTDDTRQCFDKFFTPYVLFNRLYAEATFTLARRRPILQRRIARATGFPDPQAATSSYLIEYLTARTLVLAIAANQEANNALEAVKGFIRAHTFYIRLDKVTGNRRPAEDDRLLVASVESRSANEKATAILETIYQVRCNMFHGHKGFQPVQRDLLRPIIILLETVINVTDQKLRAEP